MQIEPSTINDAAEILALQRLAYLSEAEIYNDFTIHPLTQTLAELVTEFSTHTVFKAVQQGRIVGAVRTLLVDGTCHVGKLIVHPAAQNQGIGSALMRHLEGSFPEAGRFELFTGHKSLRNLYLYDKLGYREFKRVPANGQLWLVYMEKPGAHNCPTSEALPQSLVARFDACYREHYLQVYKLAFGLANRGASATERSQDAEDITQEAFCRAFRAFASFRDESSFFTWISRIAMNVATDYMRQRKKLRIYETLDELGCTEEELKDPNPGSDPETRLLANEVMRVCMYGFTESLTIQQKRAFFLVVGFDLSYRHAAEVLGCTEGALKLLLHRAKNRLAGYMETRCSLIRKTNSCRCEQWVEACLSHGRITKECLKNPTATITIPEKVTLYLQDLRDIYQDVYGARKDEELVEILRAGFEKKRWATFS